MSDTLYDQDFVTLTERQAQALRRAAGAGSNLPVDWGKLAEEVEDLGKHIRHKIEGVMGQILLRLLKLACSPAEQSRAKWMSEVDGFRVRLSTPLRENHALRAGYGEIVDEELHTAIKLADREFRRHGEQAAGTLLLAWKLGGISAEEVVTDGLYPVPGTTLAEGEGESGRIAAECSRSVADRPAGEGA